MVAPRVYEAMRAPIVGYLDPYFFQVIEDIRKNLRAVFGTANQFTFPISGTGSAGMEAAVANFTEPRTRLAVFANGFFSDRITEMAKRQGATVLRFEKAWGEVFQDKEARDFIRRERPQVVAYVQAETSTGTFQEGRAICEAAHEVDALVIADCVTSLGAMPVQIDQIGIDIAYSCSQKGLSCPPGLSPLTLSPRAVEWLRARVTPVQSWYLDLRLLGDYFDEPHRYHHTAPISMFYALREGLALAAEEGLANRFERHRRNHMALVRALEAMGMQMYVAEGHRLWTLNTPRVPPGVDDLQVRQRLLSEHGIEILGGFGQLAGKVFRIGLMGESSREEYAVRLLEALASALRAEGFQAAGDGRAAAEQAFAALVG